ncbi:hypothetical protein ACFQVC_10030 [Streptomyces monticola]|uniref:Transmembrane protein n=1 Tax=Streptomyces monticola TaxID=2666263 RepID=A0ABW2JG97_9ACTN
MRTRVRFWRWRRNELRRRSDVVEAWTVLALGLALLLGTPAAGIAAGLAAHAEGRAAAARQTAGNRPVRAELAQDTPRLRSVSSHDIGPPRKYRATVTWTGADQKAHSGTATVPAGTHRGEHVRIWLDPHGRIVPAPANSSDVWAQTLAVAVTASGSLALFVLAARLVVRRVAQARRMAEWEQAWERAGPEWDHRKS